MMVSNPDVCPGVGPLFPLCWTGMEAGYDARQGQAPIQGCELLFFTFTPLLESRPCRQSQRERQSACLLGFFWDSAEVVVVCHLVVCHCWQGVCEGEFENDKFTVRL